jgi:hypothetical protein
MTFAPIQRGPLLDEDEARLRQLDTLITDAERAEREEAARRAEEARRRVEREAPQSGITLEQLKQRRAELAAEIAQRQHHVRLEAEREALRRHAEALSAEIQVSETRLGDLKEQRGALMRRLG